MRVLLIAEAANPEWVSVPLVGWSLCHAISQTTSAHIVTQVRNREAFLRAGLRETVDFTAVDTESIAKPMLRLASMLGGSGNKGWTAITAFQSLAYYAFERAVWRTFEGRIKKGEFDVVHRVTPVSPTAPSTLARRCARAGVPFVMGPLNGGLAWPPGFEGRRRSEREWLSYVRALYKLMPGYSSARKHSAAIIVGSEATRGQLPKKYLHKTFLLPENGVDLARFGSRRTRRASAPLTAVFIGRIVPYKCPDVLLKAGAQLIRAGKLRIRIVGDGPFLAHLQALVMAEGIGDGVDFLGWLPHTEVQSILVESDVLVLPSIREFGGGVVLEAMACGVPAIVADYGGPAELVTANTGLKIRFNSEQSLEDGLREVLQSLADEPATLDRLGDQAWTYVREEYSWQAKAKKILNIYRTVLQDHGAPSKD
jgi:glycosyltransferase involved in cell wall biosynthesis